MAKRLSIQEKLERWRREDEERVKRIAERMTWARIQPEEGTGMESVLSDSMLILKAYYHSPESRLRLENIVLKAEQAA